jgi:hypothetical protein
LISILFHFKQKVHGFLLELDFGLELLHVVWGIDASKEVVVVEPLLHVVHGETEGREELLVLIVGDLHGIPNWLRLVSKLGVEVELVVQKLDEHAVIFHLHVERGDHLKLVIEELFRAKQIHFPGHANGVLKDDVSVKLSEENSNIFPVKCELKGTISSNLFLEEWDLRSNESCVPFKVFLSKNLIN